MNYDGSHWTHSETVAINGTSVVKMPVSRPAQITVSCGAGGGATVEVTAAPLEDIDAGIATWVTVLTVTAGGKGQLGTFNSPRALRFKTTVAAARFEVSI